jgi:hypothetical protein
MNRDRYNNDEANAILQRALTRQLEQQNTTSREDLIATAREIGISQAELDAAADELASENKFQKRAKKMFSVAVPLAAVLLLLNVLTFATGLSSVPWALPYLIFFIPISITALAGHLEHKRKLRPQTSIPALPVIERQNINEENVREEVTVGSSSETPPRR